MRYPDYISKVLVAVAVIFAASACVKSDIEFETSGKDISIAPVASAVTKSIPGAVTGTDYPQNETMGIFAFHSDTAPGESWSADFTGVTPYVYYKTPDEDEDGEPDTVNEGWAAEFGVTDSNNTWGGIFSTLDADEKTVSSQRQPYQWPENGSLIFAGFSPYYKFQAVNVESQTKEGKLKPMKGMVSFNVESKALKITDYTVGQYIPMSADQIVNSDYEYVNDSQSDLMFFMPQVDKDGNYVGVNKLSAYPARFYHALSLVEFKVRAEDPYDVSHIHIDKIKLEKVYHTGDFTATVGKNGSITARWTDLEGQENIHIFGDEDAHEDGDELDLDMDLRSVAQLLIIPGPTHDIKVVCHVYTMGKYYEQTYIVEPDKVGIENWEVGKRYVYNLIVGLDKIEFSSETYDWNDVDGGGYSEPAKY